MVARLLADTRVPARLSECYDSPLTRIVTERVRNVTNIPHINHFEPFQVT
jgi:hypothetical protein